MTLAARGISPATANSLIQLIRAIMLYFTGTSG